MDYESISFRFHNFTISADYTYIYIIVYGFLQTCRINPYRANVENMVSS